MKYDWQNKYAHLFEPPHIAYKNNPEYWYRSYFYNGPDVTGEEVTMDEYIGHHYDFFWLSTVAQAARDGKIPHEWVTEAIIKLLYVDENPGDTEVPPDWNIGDPPMGS